VILTIHMSYETSNPENTYDDEQQAGRARRALRLGATTVATAILAIGAFGGTEGTTDQPHDPDKKGVDPNKFPHPDGMEQPGPQADPAAPDQQILAGPSDFDLLQLYP
jgi:hypothetical protein